MAEEEIPMEDLDSKEFVDDGKNYDDDYETKYEDDVEETSFSHDTFQHDIPDVSRDKGVMRRAFTKDKKMFLKDNFNVDVNKTAGPHSKKLFENFNVRLNKKGKVESVLYKDTIIFTRGGVEATSKKNVPLREEFYQELELARREKTKEVINSDEELRQEALSNMKELSEQKKEDIRKKMVHLTEEERREVNGVLEGGIHEQQGQTPKEKISTLDIEKTHWKDMTEKETDPFRKELFKDLVETIEFDQDTLRMENGEFPGNDTAMDIVENTVENSDLTRFKRFREFVKKNFGGISGVVIGLGGLITAVIVSARGFVKKVAKTTGDIAKGVKKVIDKVGPLLGSILSVVGSVLSLTTKALNFLAQNLWLFIVFLFMALVGYYQQKKN